MPQLYTAVDGDTFDSVSTMFYGDTSKAELLAAANGVWDGVLSPGQMLVIPPK